MLRITELRLPLDHEPDALAASVVEQLRVDRTALLSLHVARRANDARKKSAIVLVYSVDVEVRDEAQVLAALVGNSRVRRTPDTGYRPVTAASRRATERPVVIGAGPCGLFCALILAQTGLRPIIVERGKVELLVIRRALAESVEA